MNTTVPPLPFVDGIVPGEKVLIFDNSAVEKLKCARLFEYTVLRKRALSASRDGRNFGAGLHEGWAERYRHCLNKAVTPEATIAINDAMQKYFAGSPPSPNDFRTFEHACTVMKAYNEVYQNEPWQIVGQPPQCKNPGKPIIEEAFLLPFGFVQNIPIYYAGKIDLVITDNVGLWVFDHKSAFQFGESFEKQMKEDGGQMGYVWATQQIIGKKPDGYIIDAVRIRRPTKKSEYTGSPPVDASDMNRIPRFVSQSDIDEWKKDVIHLIGGAIVMHDQGYFPRCRWQCVGKYGPCDMYEVCSNPQEHREAILTGTLFEHDDWSPLKQ